MKFITSNYSKKKMKYVKMERINSMREMFHNLNKKSLLSLPFLSQRNIDNTHEGIKF